MEEATLKVRKSAAGDDEAGVAVVVVDDDDTVFTVAAVTSLAEDVVLAEGAVNDPPAPDAPSPSAGILPLPHNKALEFCMNADLLRTLLVFGDFV